MFHPDSLFEFYKDSGNDWIRSALFQQLPDILSSSTVSFLLACDGKERLPGPAKLAHYHIRLRKALENSDLKGVHVNVSEKFIPDAIHRDELKRYLQSIRQWPVKDCLLSNWWMESEEPQAEPDPKPTGETKGRGHVQERRDILAAMLDEIERRAASQGIPFNRGEFPGTKDEFREFAKRYNPSLRSLPTNNDSIDRDLKPLGVKFLQGNHKGKGVGLFKDLFPELYR